VYTEWNKHSANYGRPLSVSGRPCYVLPMFFLNLFFYGRLILRPWLTEVRESFTCGGGPWVSLEKLVLGFFPGHPETTGWAKKWRNLAYFQILPANFLLSRPNAAEYCNSGKKLLSTDGCSTRNATFGELWPTNPWDPRVTKFLKKWRAWIACDMPYFRLLDASTTTPKHRTIRQLSVRCYAPIL